MKLFLNSNEETPKSGNELVLFWAWQGGEVFAYCGYYDERTETWSDGNESFESDHVVAWASTDTAETRLGLAPFMGKDPDASSDPFYVDAMDKAKEALI